MPDVDGGRVQRPTEVEMSGRKKGESRIHARGLCWMAGIGSEGVMMMC